MTTHFMEEAEILGDRIGIMKEGEVLYSENSYLLKHQSNCGICLIVQSTLAKPNYELDIFLFDKLKGIQKISSKSKGTIYKIKRDELNLIPSLKLDEEKSKFGIENY